MATSGERVDRELGPTGARFIDIDVDSILVKKPH